VEHGVVAVWRCHVGIDEPGELARGAWQFLIGYVLKADAYVFSRRSFAWDGLDEKKIVVIAPSIDAFSPKNRDMDGYTVRAILRRAALLRGPAPKEAVYFRQDGSPAKIEHEALVYETKTLKDDTPVVLQVSRWDRLKDPLGVIKGFADYIAPHTDAHLVYAGPEVAAISDDPEGKQVLDEAVGYWEGLAPERRSRIHLATLPMADGEENAAIVNALQRHAYVVVQKSIAEGFGLTVAEAMWKGRPVVASRIGGIQDQIEHGKTGLLLDDPRDLAQYGECTVAVLHDERWARAMGAAAMEKVRSEFLGARSLIDYAKLCALLVGVKAGSA
jgi:trehalose synthase